jgi:hypothetical protein
VGPATRDVITLGSLLNSCAFWEYQGSRSPTDPIPTRRLTALATAALNLNPPNIDDSAGPKPTTPTNLVSCSSVQHDASAGCEIRDDGIARGSAVAKGHGPL